MVAHTGIIAMPMRKDARRLHRSVVLPDYQGIGIGMAFKAAVCDYIRSEGWHGTIWSTTTTPAQYHAQVISPLWKLVRYGRAAGYSKKIDPKLLARMEGNSSKMRITYSFIYLGKEGKERI